MDGARWRRKGVWRPGDGPGATSDVHCSTVRASAANGIRTAVAAGVATRGITPLRIRCIAVAVTAEPAVTIAAILDGFTRLPVAARARGGGRDAQGRKGKVQAVGWFETYQPSQLLPSSCRRSRAPPIPPGVIIVACEEKASASSVDGSVQPLAAESMARWTSTRTIVIGEEAVPRNRSVASATGAAATVASRALRSFGDGAPSESPISSGQPFTALQPFGAWLT